MTKHDLRIAKRKILKCLTEEFTYGTTDDGKPLKHPRQNNPIFDAKDGFAIYAGTDLEMVMDKVVLGLYFAIADTSVQENEDGRISAIGTND